MPHDHVVLGTRQFILCVLRGKRSLTTKRLLEAMSSDVQTPLDRSQGDVEFRGDLYERLPLQVERFKGVSVDGPELSDRRPDLLAPLAINERLERSLSGLASLLEQLVLRGRKRRPTSRSIDRDAHRNLVQPRAEARRLPELRQLPHGVQEDFLNEFGRFLDVSMTPPGDRED